jgi:hypothetical protein
MALDVSVRLTLDRERAITMDFEAASEAERTLGQIYGRPFNLLAALVDQERFGITEVGVLLWTSLRRTDPTLTLSDTFHLLTLENYQQVMEALFAAWNKANQRASGQEKAEPDGPFSTPSPGSSSGALPVSSLA